MATSRNTFYNEPIQKFIKQTLCFGNAKHQNRFRFYDVDVFGTYKLRRLFTDGIILQMYSWSLVRHHLTAGTRVCIIYPIGMFVNIHRRRDGSNS